MTASRVLKSSSEKKQGVEYVLGFVGRNPKGVTITVITALGDESLK